MEVKKLDIKVFEEIFKENFTKLCSYARTFIKDFDTSKEIVHDCFVILWDKRSDIDLSKNVKSYLYTSVHNKCLNYIRDNKKFTKNFDSLETGIFDISINDNNKLEFEEVQTKINDAINSLPEKCREIFKMNRFGEMKYKEIAEKLGISIKTVEAQMSKALTVMRENLKEYISVLIILIKLFIK